MKFVAKTQHNFHILQVPPHKVMRLSILLEGAAVEPRQVVAQVPLEVQAYCYLSNRNYLLKISPRPLMLLCSIFTMSPSEKVSSTMTSKNSLSAS